MGDYFDWSSSQTKRPVVEEAGQADTAPKRAKVDGECGAVVEYLKFMPMCSETAVKAFEKRVDAEWSDTANFYEVVIENSKKVLSLAAVRAAAEELSTSMERCPGDCADTAAAVLDKLQVDPRGPWTVEHHRLVFYEAKAEGSDGDGDGDGDGDYEYVFVQNHEYVVAYDATNNWFRRGRGFLTEHVFFGDSKVDPETVRSLYVAVRDGNYDRAAPDATFAQRVRLEVVKSIESTPIKAVGNSDSISLAATELVYRGFNFRDNAHLDAFLKDPHPWSPYDDEGKPKDPDPEAGLSGGETYNGMYVTIDGDQARAYSRQEGATISAVVSFHWPVIRAMYVCGFIDFVTSNDVAFKTDDFTDENKAKEVIEDVNYILKNANVPDDIKVAIFGDKTTTSLERIQDEPASIIWAAIEGRNRELAISGVGTEYPMEGFDWKSPYGDSVVHDVAVFGASQQVDLRVI